jgi:ankyrin repeat protein
MQFSFSKSYSLLFLLLCVGNASHSITTISSPLKKALTEQKNRDLFFAILDDKPNTKTIEMLLKQGANPNAKTWDGTETPALIAAVLTGNEEIVPVLLAQGADINGIDKDGNSALMYAMEHNNISLMKLLLKKGIALNIETAAFMRAIFHGKEEAVRLFIANGIDINAKDEDLSTPLMIAVTLNHLTIAQLLINNGAKVNEKYTDDKCKNVYISPLLAAILNRNPAMVQLLIENGADKAAIYQDGKTDGKTALDFAIEQGNNDIIALLKA